jgi:hypothetical protein
VLNTQGHGAERPCDAHLWGRTVGRGLARHIAFFCQPRARVLSRTPASDMASLVIAKKNPNGRMRAGSWGYSRCWIRLSRYTKSGPRVRAGTHKEAPLTALTQRFRTLVTRSFAQTRQAPRFAFTDSIEVRTASGAVFRGIARDLSRRGLGAIVFADLQVDDSVVVKYAHPQRSADSQIVVRYARVRTRYGSRYGFEFEQAMECPLTPNESARERILEQ